MRAQEDALNSGLYDALGGAKTCRRLAEAFYARVPRDPVLRAIYPASSHCAVDALAAYFIQIFGGSNDYSRRRWWLSLHQAHARFRIGPAEREAWLKTMDHALEDVQVAEPARTTLRRFFGYSSAYLVNQPGAGEKEPNPSFEAVSSLDREISKGWAAQQAVDEIAQAIRKRDAERAIRLIESHEMRDYLEKDRATFVAILAAKMTSGSPILADYVRQTLVSQPDLARDRYYYYRTLLHEAAGKSDRTFVELLLGLGADPNDGTDLGHTPLYCAGNEHGNESVVRILVRAGADVNAQDKTKRCTALHMAARRGNIVVAKALLDCGADIEARDSKAETPLRRAVNCGKPEMAAFLLSRGANPDSLGSKGLTAWQAARGEGMKRVFGSPDS